MIRQLYILIIITLLCWLRYFHGQHPWKCIVDQCLYIFRYRTLQLPSIWCLESVTALFLISAGWVGLVLFFNALLYALSSNIRLYVVQMGWLCSFIGIQEKKMSRKRCPIIKKNVSYQFYTKYAAIRDYYTLFPYIVEHL